MGNLNSDQNFFRYLFDSADILVSAYDCDGVCLFMNEKVANLFNGQPEDFVGISITELHPKMQDEYYKRIQEAIDTGKSKNYEDLVCFPEGNRWLFSEVHPVKDAHGTIIAAQIISQDITERVKAKEALERSESKLRLAQKIANIGNWSWNILKDEVEWSQQVYEIFKAPHKILTFEFVKSYVHPDDINHWQNTVQEAVEKQEPFAMDYRAVRSDGVTIWVHNETTTVFNHQGVFTGFQGTVQDVTERILSQKALKESEERFRGIFENATIGIYRTNPDGEILMANPTLVRMLGYSTFEELAQRNLNKQGYEPGYPRSVFQEQIDREGEVIGLEAAWERQDGSTLFVRESAKVIRDPAGKVLYYEGTVEDITERKLAQRALRKSEEKFRLLVETINEGIWQINAEGFTTYVNPKLAMILGYTIEEMLGKHLFTFMDKDWVEVAKGNLDKGQQGIAEQHEFTFRRKSGQPVHTLLNTTPVYDDQGNYTGALAGLSDITERKKAEQSLSESEAKMRSIFQIAPVGIGIIANREFQEVNDQFCRMTGYSRQELIGTNARILYPSDEDYEFVAKEKYRQISETGLGTVQTRFQRKDGKIIHVLLSSTPLDPNNPSAGFTSTALEITDQVLAEKALVQEQANLTALIENIDGSVWSVDKDIRLIVGNSKFHQDIRSVRGKPFDAGDNILSEDFPIDVLSEWSGYYQRTLSGEIYRVENPRNFIDNSRLMEYHFTPILDADGTVTGITVIGMDITERIQAAKALQESEERFRKLFELSALGISIFNCEPKIIEANQAICNMLGYTRQELLETGLEGVSHPDDLQKDLDLFTELHNGKIEYYTIEKRYLHKSGEIVWGELTVSLVRDDKGEMLFGIGMIIDITDRKRAQERIARFGHIFEESLNEIYMFDAESLKFKQINNAALNNLGYSIEELHEMTPVDVKPDYNLESFEKLIAPLRNGEEQELVFETIHQRKDGSLYDIEVHLQLLQHGGEALFTAIILDITERKQAQEWIQTYSEKLEAMVEERTHELEEAQERLMRQERLAVLGQLAGSIGHELRNPLGVISNASYYLSTVLPDPAEDVKETLEMIDTEAHNAAKIITDLLDFARSKPIDRTSAQVSDLVADALQHYPAPDNVTIITNLPEDLPPVHVDPLQIRQVIENLITNAYQAMPDGGQLSIEPCPSSKSNLEEAVLSLCIRDTGSGIAPENMEKIFEPLFTTKARGIGLGLAVCKRIMEANEGQIQVQSALGKGTTFIVSLPVYEEFA